MYSKILNVFTTLVRSPLLSKADQLTGKWKRGRPETSVWDRARELVRKYPHRIRGFAECVQSSADVRLKIGTREYPCMDHKLPTLPSISSIYLVD